MSARFRPVTTMLPVVYGPFQSSLQKRATRKAVALFLRRG
jgi:hypothetical protein